MKKHHLGKKILFAGSILTVAFACQPKTPNADSSQKPETNQNPAQSDNEDEDIDDGAYGDGDTSSSCDKECGAQLHKVESATDVTDVKEAEEAQIAPVVSAPEAVPEASVSKVEAPNTESLTSEVVGLESVSPIEIVAEHQEIVENSSQKND